MFLTVSVSRLFGNHRRNGDFVDSQSFYRCLVVRSVARSEHHHTSPNNLALSEQLKLLADVIKSEHLDGVTNLVLSGKGHDLAQICVVTPKRAMKSFFAGYARE